MAFFNSFKYGSGVEGDNTFVDASDAYANHVQTVISFQHVPTGKAVYFKAFLNSFNETYNSDWAQENVYGRADPIYMFKQTNRQIALNFKIPASTAGEAYENLGKVQAVTQFLYPTYTNVNQAQTISQSPLIRIKVMNLLRRNAEENASAPTTPADSYNDYKSDVSAENGLLGIISNFVVNHNLEGENGVVEKGPNVVLPKLIDVAITFSVIHEHPLGWGADNEFSEKAFPYGVGLIDDDAPPVEPLPAPNTDTDNDQNKADQIATAVATLAGVVSTTTATATAAAVVTNGDVGMVGGDLIGIPGSPANLGDTSLPGASLGPGMQRLFLNKTRRR
jgi:hypothetical protein